MGKRIKIMKSINIDTDGIHNPDETVKYLSEIRKFKVLSREEELDYIKRIRDGEEGAFDNFVKCNLLLAFKMAKRYIWTGYPFSDLVQAANIGLVKGAHKYAFEIGTTSDNNYTVNKFTSYCVHYIRKEILDELERNGKSIRLPHEVQITGNKLKKVFEKIECEELPDYDIERLSEMTGETVKDIEHTLKSRMTIDSLEMSITDHEGNPLTIEDTLPSRESADKGLMSDEKHRLVERLLSGLDEKEKVVVMMSFGIGYDYEHDSAAISGKTGISVGKVKSILENSMKKLRTIGSEIK